MLLEMLRQKVQNVVAAPLYSYYEKQLERELEGAEIPQHVGIILDGNRRFARLAGMKHAVQGHLFGANKLREMLRWCYEFRIPVITIWIFSLDNFDREHDEVLGLFRLIEDKTREWMRDPEIREKRVRFRYSGRTELLPPSLQEAIASAEAQTASHNDFVLNIAIAYGGREEITDAMRRYLDAGAKEGLSVKELRDRLDPEALEPYLYTSGLPEPDLIIRTSGELRLSGFLLWQSAYSEYYFCDVLWPQFRRVDFLRALRSFAVRKRRFGK